MNFIPIDGKMPVMETALERYREAHGMTLEALAEMAGFRSVSTVHRHCKGSTISAELAVRYHKAFGIPLSDLRPDLWPPEPTGHEPYRQEGEGA